MSCEDRLHEIFNEIEDIVSNADGDRVRLFLLDLFNLLFWKDSRAGYVDLDTRYELATLFDCYTKRRAGEDEWYSFDDRAHVYEVVSKVRKMIGIEEDLP